MHLARHWGQRWTVACHKTSSTPFRCGYGSKSWYSMGFHDSFHIKICRLLRNYGCWFIHVPVHTLCFYCFSHPHEALSSLSVRVFQVGCFHILEITVSFSYSLSLSLSFSSFWVQALCLQIQACIMAPTVPKPHGNPTQTLCFPSDCLGLAWVFDGSSMGFWWHFVIGRPLPLWINPPIGLVGGHASQKKKWCSWKVFLTRWLLCSPHQPLFPIWMCHLWA